MTDTIADPSPVPAGDPAPARPVPPGWTPLTERAVRRICTLTDPAVRNLWITQSYADLGRRLLDIYRTDQTWCTFAAWSSNAAAVSIRREDLPAFVGRLLEDGGDHLDAVVTSANDHPSVLSRFVGRLRRSQVERRVTEAVVRVVEHVVHGNTIVYSELAPFFVRFAERLEESGPPPADGIEDLLTDIGLLRGAGDPLVDLAFRSYTAATTTADPDARAQLVLTANLATVLHEQRRLQDDISAALDAGLVDVEREIEELPHRWLPGPVWRWLVRRATSRVGPHVAALWRHVVTRILTTLDMPGATLHCDADVPTLPDGRRFPAALELLDRPELLELIHAWDPTGGTGRGSGARDWGDLGDRMGYLVNLFRSRQRELTLTAPPFTATELDEMIAGELPST